LVEQRSIRIGFALKGIGIAGADVRKFVP